MKNETNDSTNEKTQEITLEDCKNVLIALPYMMTEAEIDLLPVEIDLLSVEDCASGWLLEWYLKNKSAVAEKAKEIRNGRSEMKKIEAEVQQKMKDALTGFTEFFPIGPEDDEMAEWKEECEKYFFQNKKGYSKYYFDLCKTKLVEKYSTGMAIFEKEMERFDQALDSISRLRFRELFNGESATTSV